MKLLPIEDYILHTLLTVNRFIPVTVIESLTENIGYSGFNTAMVLLHSRGFITRKFADEDVLFDMVRIAHKGCSYCFLKEAYKWDIKPSLIGIDVNNSKNGGCTQPIITHKLNRETDTWEIVYRVPFMSNDQFIIQELTGGKQFQIICTLPTRVLTSQQTVEEYVLAIVEIDLPNDVTVDEICFSDVGNILYVSYPNHSNN